MTEMKDKNYEDDKMSRKEALKKGGKYAAFTAAGMMFFFSPSKAQKTSKCKEGVGNLIKYN